MKFLVAVLLLVLAGLQYRLWLSDDGIRSVLNLRQSVAAQTAENETLSRRNDQLAAEVKDLKEGLAALEERARTDLGMVGSNETFFQVVENPTPAGAAPVAPASQTPPVQRTSR
jgi:cell division protein FtsB